MEGERDDAAAAAPGGDAVDAAEAATKADELFAVGEHCQVCGSLDFLPIRCESCGGGFCSAHRLASSHECRGHKSSSTAAVAAEHNQGAAVQVQRCGVASCAAEAKVKPCDGCGVEHCPAHRHPQDHSCPAAATQSADDLAARERAEAIHRDAKEKADAARVAADVKRAARRKKLNPKKLQSAATIAKMKMKMSATGDRGIAEDARFYLRVVLDPFAVDGEIPQAKALFFPKRCVVGKCLDQCADKFRVSVQPVPAHAGGPLRAFRVAAPPLLLPNHKALGSIDGLLNGDSIVLSRRSAEELELDDAIFR